MLCIPQKHCGAHDKRNGCITDSKSISLVLGSFQQTTINRIIKHSMLACYCEACKLFNWSLMRLVTDLGCSDQWI